MEFLQTATSNRRTSQTFVYRSLVYLRLTDGSLIIPCCCIEQLCPAEG